MKTTAVPEASIQSDCVYWSYSAQARGLCAVITQSELISLQSSCPLAPWCSATLCRADPLCWGSSAPGHSVLGQLGHLVLRLRCLWLRSFVLRNPHALVLPSPFFESWVFLSMFLPGRVILSSPGSRDWGRVSCVQGVYLSRKGAEEREICRSETGNRGCAQELATAVHNWASEEPQKMCLGIENSKYDGRAYASICFSLPLLVGGPSVIFLPALPVAHAYG